MTFHTQSRNKNVNAYVVNRDKEMYGNSCGETDLQECMRTYGIV